MSGQAQGVNISPHEVPKGLVHHAMPLERVCSRKLLRDDPHTEMAPAVPGARVPGM